MAFKKDTHLVLPKLINFHPAQKIIDSSKARFKVVEAGVRFGKTEYEMQYLLDGAAIRPGSKNWAIFPFAKQGRSVLWDRLLKFIPPAIRSGRPNKTFMDIPLVNGSSIGIRGSDNEEALLGEKIGRIAMDEAARHKAHIWEEILRHRLLDYRGEGLFISSPKGHSWHHKLYQMAISGADPEWAGFHFTTYDNPYISREELDKLKKITPPRIWNRDYMAIAAEDEGVVYGEYGVKNRFEHGVEFADHESNSPCGRGLDWGAGISGDPAACIWAHISGNDILISEEHVQENWPVGKHADVIREKSLGRKMIDGLTVLDQSAFRTEGSSMTNIAKLFGDNGIHCIRSEKTKDTGISIVKALLDGKPGEARLLISDRCVQTHNAMKNWEYGQHEPDPIAALRYIVVAMYRRGLFKLTTTYKNDEPIADHVFNPNSLFDRRRVSENKKENEDLRWDDSAGCFE